MLSSPDWLPNLGHVHPPLIHLFPIREVTAPLVGRTAKLLANWKLITSDRAILDIVKGWVIPLLRTPNQTKIPHSIKMNSVEERAMDQEIESMLAKGATREEIPKETQFLSNVFVTPKG